MASILRVRDNDGNIVEIPVMQGPPGPVGNTPEKGVDYWTEDDKSEVVSDVLAALPTWEGGSY